MPTISMELQEIMRYIVSVCGFIPTHIHGQTLVVSRRNSHTQAHRPTTPRQKLVFPSPLKAEGEGLGQGYTVYTVLVPHMYGQGR